MARPTKYKQSYCARVVRMGKKGLYPAEMAAQIGVSKNTLLRWTDDYPEFRDSLSMSKTHCEAYELQQLKGRKITLAEFKWKMSALFKITETKRTDAPKEAPAKAKTTVEFADREDVD